MFGTQSSSIPKLAQLMRGMKRLMVITGAGISSESGLPTYRGVSGLYNQQETSDGISIEEALSGKTWLSHPEIVWKHLLQIEESCRNATFNSSHQILAEMEQMYEICILTQNIDGFHHLAGSSNIIDIHGNLYELSCQSCGQITQVKSYTQLEKIPPDCPSCQGGRGGGLLRPNVVLFGEFLAQKKVSKLQNEMNRGYDLVMSIGTTSVFPYISAPVFDAQSLGKPVVEINPAPTEVSDCANFIFRKRAEQVLPELWKELRKERTKK